MRKKTQDSRLKTQVRAHKRRSLESDFLLEIGTEELPAAYLDAAIVQLREETGRLFRDAHLSFGAVETFGTPRRLVALVRGLDVVRHHPPEEIRGPSKQAAFDAQGNPTPALNGFLKSRGGTLARTKIVTMGKSEYVYLIKPERRTPAAQALPGLVTQLLARVKFPKTMRWDGGGVRFARPVRWLLVLYGAKPVKVVVGRVVSGSRTWIGGPKQPKAVTAAAPSGYFTTLARAGVLLDQRRRRAKIDGLVKSLAKKPGGVPAPETVSHGLLDEVTHLVERPVALAGQFDRKYLALPREVLLASMAKYQRVFALQTAGGKLLPRFVAILDGTPRNVAGVRHVYEHILNARLADSLLFWNQDQKRSLEAMRQQLSHVTFYEDLGSMAEKADRMHQLAAVFEKTWNLSQEQFSHLRRACELAKADLVSTVVKEFPTLQGVIGNYYAEHQKESATVAEAIGEHYLPVGGELPKTLVGSALAILDKYDTLVSHFSKGRMPTGDQDPLGLRRAAQGIVEVAWSIHKPLPVDRLGGGPRVRAYLAERLYTFAWPAPAPSRDLIDAVLGSPWDDLVNVMDRIRALRQMDGNQALLRAAKVVERTTNILKGASLKQGRVDAARFKEPLEQQLWDRYQQNQDRVLQLVRSRSYAEATTAYGEAFFGPLHEFFERVMVNVEDEALQQNRLALMKAINVLYTAHIADLSKLAILQPRQSSASP